MAKNIVPSLRLGWYHSVNSTRSYSKWFHRRPVKVILPEDLEKKESRRAKLKVERQVSFVENLEKPDPFLLEDIIKDHGDPLPKFNTNTDVTVRQSKGTSGNIFEFDHQDKVHPCEAGVNSGTTESSVLVAGETNTRAKMKQRIEKLTNPFEFQTSESVSSGEEKVFAERNEGGNFDTNINKTHFCLEIDDDSRTTNVSKSINDGTFKRYKRKTVERPKTLQSKVDADIDDFKERFSDDSDNDSVSSDEEMERAETKTQQIPDMRFTGTVIETTDTSGKQIKFTKLSDSDSRLSKLMLVAKSRNMKKKKNIIVLEGKRLIQDFIKSGIMPLSIFFSRLDDIIMFDFGCNKVPLYKMTYKKLSLWSDLVTSPGVIGVFRRPNLANRDYPKDALPITVICDNVRDPGNMGSILRIVAGVGCQQIIVPKGCVDIWDTKVLRAAGGAHLRVPIMTDVQWSEVPNCFPYNHNMFVADSCTDIQSSDMHTPLLPYFSVDFSAFSHLVLVIGGETGLSVEAMSLVEKGGTRLNVPLCSGVESLNTSVALAVILFEMKRQVMYWSLKNTSQALKQ